MLPVPMTVIMPVPVVSIITAMPTVWIVMMVIVMSWDKVVRAHRWNLCNRCGL